MRLIMNRCSNIMLSFFIYFLAIAPCNAKNDDEAIIKPSWYTSAEKYIEADKTMIDNGVKQKPTFLNDFGSRSKAEKELLNAPDPSEIELEKLLQSDDVEKIKIALINIRTKKYYSEKLYKMIAHLYFKYDDFWFRYYIITCFKILDQASLKKNEDLFLELISKDKSNFFIAESMWVTIRLDESKALPVFIDNLKNGDSRIRRMAIAIICSKGTDGFIEKLRERLIEKGSKDILGSIETCINEKSEWETEEN